MAPSKHTAPACPATRPTLVCVCVCECPSLCATVRVCVHVIEPTAMQVVAVAIDTWAAPSVANSCGATAAHAAFARVASAAHTAHTNVGANAVQCRLSAAPGNMQHCDWSAHSALIKFAWPTLIG